MLRIVKFYVNLLTAVDVQATCSNLGIFDGEKYLPEPDCVECVKDLIRFLRYRKTNNIETSIFEDNTRVLAHTNFRRDDENHCVRRALGSLGVLRSDLVPLLRC